MHPHILQAQQETKKVESNSKPMQLGLSLVKYNTENVFNLLLRKQIFKKTFKNVKKRDMNKKRRNVF